MSFAEDLQEKLGKHKTEEVTKNYKKLKNFIDTRINSRWNDDYKKF